ncbi:ParB/RepB/Spo0J family partition protein [Planktotalea sp.]|uniref:ParB/RepB/Spo0J family partition protein n=1 Tax=Planktotalea sp. TaxID=2029877 RepID=UPI003D6A7FC1
MAKRRKVAAPSADDLNRIEEEFRRETSPRSAMAPISQISADAALSANPVDAKTRAADAKQKADADALQRIREEGRELLSIPLDQIDARAMIRDRTMIDADEMSELTNSIEAHGMRLPIEVFRRETPKDDTKEGRAPYGLLSGFRRYKAMSQLAARRSDPKWQNITAIERDPDALGGAITAMVEENEIRSNLSHYERGRIAVVAAQQGVFGSTEEGVNTLFAVASKAKRSKIRAFALIFEELGDMLMYPEAIKEREGLRLANALRNGSEADLRDILARGTFENAEAEWAALVQVIDAAAPGARKDPARGGRPKGFAAKPGWQADTRVLSSGVTLRHDTDSNGHMIRIGGDVDQALVESALEHLAYLLEKPSD